MYGNEWELMYSLKEILSNKSLLNVIFLICLNQSKKAGEVNTNKTNKILSNSKDLKSREDN